MIKELKNEEEFNKIINNEKVLVDFFATWCGPCKMLAPVLESFSKEHEDLTILKVDVDLFSNIAREYSIMSVPTLITFDKGQIINKESGFRSSTELEELVK